MANSVEIRLPYLDYRVAEYACRLPARWRMRGLQEKYILREVLEKTLPWEVLSRHKHPYRAPIQRALLNAKTADYTTELLEAAALRESGLFDADKVGKFLQKLQGRDADNEVDGMALAGIISTQLLYRQYIRDFSARPARVIEPRVVIDRRAAARGGDGRQVTAKNR
jgi:asparagine synthase (glutamine-hydrolysing)